MSLIIAAYADHHDTIGPDVAGHKLKYWDLSRSFEKALKTDRPQNTCQRLGESLVVECDAGFNFVEDATYPYCQLMEFLTPDKLCKGFEFEGECLQQYGEQACGEGFIMEKNKDKKTCHRTDFKVVDFSCELGYEIIEGKKGPICEKKEDECVVVCPEGSVEVGFPFECIAQQPVWPPSCPAGFSLNDDFTFCTREVQRPCDKKDAKLNKKGALRMLKEKNEEEEGAAVKGKGRGVAAVKGRDRAGAAGKGRRSKSMNISKGKHTAMNVVEEEDFVVSRLINRGLCTYEEIAPVEGEVEDVSVPAIEQCAQVVSLLPIERECPIGYDLVRSQFDKQMTCIRSVSSDAHCPDGIIEIENTCYQEMARSEICPVGFRLNGLDCERTEILPPTYSWMQARKCTGYSCNMTFDTSCLLE